MQIEVTDKEHGTTTVCMIEIPDRRFSENNDSKNIIMKKTNKTDKKVGIFQGMHKCLRKTEWAFCPEEVKGIRYNQYEFSHLNRV